MQFGHALKGIVQGEAECNLSFYALCVKTWYVNGPAVIVMTICVLVKIFRSGIAGKLGRTGMRCTTALVTSHSGGDHACNL